MVRISIYDTMEHTLEALEDAGLGEWAAAIFTVIHTFLWPCIKALPFIVPDLSGGFNT